jgi:flap endonuclease-1
VIEHLREKESDKAEAEEGKKKKGGISVPEEWPWEEAKKVFQKPDVMPAEELELEWTNPDVDGLVQFLVTEKGFSEERVRKGAEKLSKYLNSKQQGRLDGFFTVKPKPASPKKDKGKEKDGGKGKGKGKADVKGTKRKNDDKKDGESSKKSKMKK